MGVGQGRWDPLLPHHLITENVRARGHPFFPLAAVCELAGPGGGGEAGGGPAVSLPAPRPAPPAGLRHKCWDSHGSACSAAGGPGTRGPGDVADTEGFVDTVTSALPI